MKTIPNITPNHPESQVIRTTRIDLHAIPQGLAVYRYAEGWTASTPAFDKHVNPEWTLDQAIAWLQSNGWTVRSWNTGARAWLGQVLPVRDKSGILRKRRHLERYPNTDLQAHALDLAYDL